jgi:hypothetical protein
MEQSRVGVLSPDFFAICIDGFILILKQSGIGYHNLKVFLACILFADDMSLLAPSCDALQKMLGICLRYCQQFCLQFSVKKTKILVFGKNSRHLDTLLPLSLNNEAVDYVMEISWICCHLRL